MCLHSMKARHLRTTSGNHSTLTETNIFSQWSKTTLTSNWKSSSLNLLTLKLVKKATTPLILYSAVHKAAVHKAAVHKAAVHKAAVHKAAVLPTTPARSNCGVCCQIFVLQNWIPTASWSGTEQNNSLFCGANTNTIHRTQGNSWRKAIWFSFWL